MIQGRIEVTNVERIETRTVGEKLVKVEGHAFWFYRSSDPIREATWIVRVEDQPKVGDAFYVWISPEEKSNED